MEKYIEIITVKGEPIQLTIHENTKGFFGRCVNMNLESYKESVKNGRKGDDYYGVTLRDRNNNVQYFTSLNEAISLCSTRLLVG